MKNTEYKKPILDIIVFENNDIITDSSQGLPDNNANDIWNIDPNDIA